MATTLLDQVSESTVGEWKKWSGGAGHLFLCGVMSNGTVFLELSNDSGASVYPATFLDGSDIEVTKNDLCVQYSLPSWGAGVDVRARIVATIAAPVTVQII